MAVVAIESAAAGSAAEPALLAGDEQLLSNRLVAASSAAPLATIEREESIAFKKEAQKNTPAELGEGIAYGKSRWALGLGRAGASVG